MAKVPRLLRARPGRAWAGIEGPRGLYGTYAVSDGTDQPFRMKIHDPSFVHLQLVGHADAEQPDRGHDGRHGLARPDHGRDRQVGPGMTTLNRAWGNLTLAGRVLLPLLFVVLDRRPDPRGARRAVRRAGAGRRPRREPGHRPVRGRGHGRAAVQHPGRVHHHLHGDEGHRADEPSRSAPTASARSGSLLSVVHGLKVLMKEDFTPTGADRLVFTLAPVVVFLTAVMTFLVIPFGPGLVRPGPQHRPALPVRRGRHERRRAADGRLGELQQVLAARRTPVRGAGRQLRDPAHAVRRRA